MVDTKPSRLGVPQPLEGPVDPAEILELDLQGVFWLEPEQRSGTLLEKLRSGDVLKCPFNYAPGLEVDTERL